MMPVIVWLWLASNTLVGGSAYARDTVVFMEVVGPASCVVWVLGLLGGDVYACVLGLFVGAVCCVQQGGPAGGVMDGGM